MKSTRTESPGLKSKVGIFDLVNDVSFDKKGLVRKDGFVDTVALSTYNPFLTNRALSMHLSSVMDASIMNEAFHLDPIMQYDFYFYGLHKQRRYGSWPKTDDDTDLELISRTFNVGKIEAGEMKTTLLDSQLEALRQLDDAVGGQIKKQRK